MTTAQNRSWAEFVDRIRRQEGDAIADLIERYVEHGPSPAHMHECALCGTSYEAAACHGSPLCSEDCLREITSRQTRVVGTLPYGQIHQ